MNFQTLFELYYTLYRGESVAPGQSDPEWTLAWRFYNDALQRMSKMDDTKWNFLYSTLQASTQVFPVLVKTLQAGVTTYACPADMQEPGGMIQIGGRNYKVVQPHEVQSLSAGSQFAWFTGNEQSGFILHINRLPSTQEAGMAIDYTYYRKPTLITMNETGSTIVEGGDPAYYYNHMLAQRYRVSRNYPSYQTALRDSEEALKGMKLKNNSGTYYNAWSMQDTGPGFGY